MQKEFIWNLFLKSGNIDLYLMFKKYENNRNENSDSKSGYYDNDNMINLALR